MVSAHEVQAGSCDWYVHLDGKNFERATSISELTR